MGWGILVQIIWPKWKLLGCPQVEFLRSCIGQLKAFFFLVIIIFLKSTKQTKKLCICHIFLKNTHFEHIWMISRLSLFIFTFDQGRLLWAHNFFSWPYGKTDCCRISFPKCTHLHQCITTPSPHTYPLNNHCQNTDTVECYANVDVWHF